MHTSTGSILVLELKQIHTHMCMYVYACIYAPMYLPFALYDLYVYELWCRSLPLLKKKKKIGMAMNVHKKGASTKVYTSTYIDLAATHPGAPPLPPPIIAAFHHSPSANGASAAIMVLAKIPREIIRVKLSRVILYFLLTSYNLLHYLITRREASSPLPVCPSGGSAPPEACGPPARRPSGPAPGAASSGPGAHGQDFSKTLCESQQLHLH